MFRTALISMFLTSTALATTWTVDDAHDIAEGFSQDCNSNGIPDACDIAYGGEDVNSNNIPDECECIGDVSGNDMNVDIQDLLHLISNWGFAGSSDINVDGIVDVQDLFLLIDNWGLCT